MSDIQRYAVYYAPRPGAFATLAMQWVGWNGDTGAPVVQPAIAAIAVPLLDLTVDARRYGFHGTIRAPFRPGPDVSVGDIYDCVAELAARIAPVHCDGLQLENLQGFLALTPTGCEAALLDLGATVVEATDRLRHTLSAEDLARRRPESLTTRQRSLLDRWGYPFVMEEFRFHLTLTDQLAAGDLPIIKAAAMTHFSPIIDRPFAIDDLCLFGETVGGKFHLIHRYPLTG